MQAAGRVQAVAESERQLERLEYAPGLAWHDIVSEAARERVQAAVLKELERRQGEPAARDVVPLECLPCTRTVEHLEARQDLKEFGRDKEEFG